MNMLSPLIWVWPTGSIRKVLFLGRLLARAELSGLGFYPCLAFSRLLLWGPHLSLSSPASPQTCLTGWTRSGLLSRLQKSFICALRPSNLDLIKGACLLILFIGKGSTSYQHWMAHWPKKEVANWSMWCPFVETDTITISKIGFLKIIEYSFLFSLIWIVYECEYNLDLLKHNMLLTN